jgi:hypothetical protein
MSEIAEEKIQRKVVDNSNYHERFQFSVWVNDNIICQRYFKINRFNPECLTSKELFDVFDGYRGHGQEKIEYFEQASSVDGTKYQCGIVQLIQRDLESKSRIYTNATAECRTKLTGFDGGEPKYVEWCPKPWDAAEFVKPWDVTFKFMFLVDDKVVYERVWDGSQYPKYVRNSVDLTNSRSQYPLVQLMNSGKQDLVVEIIRRICAVASSMDDDEPRHYTKSVRYASDDAFRRATENGGDTYKVWSFDGKQGLVCEDCKPGPIECLQDGFPGACLENQIANEKSAATRDGGAKYLYSVYNKDYVNSWRYFCHRKYKQARIV